MADYKISLSRLLNSEGGKVNDPKDHGGKTNFGITQRSWDAYLKLFLENNLPADVFNITRDHAATFYLVEYWGPMKLTQVASQPLADALFSFGVNQGAATVIKRLQAIVGGDRDGIMGPHTLMVIEAQDAKVLCNAFCDATKQFYADIIAREPDQDRFKNGWNNRIAEYRVTA